MTTLAKFSKINLDTLKKYLSFIEKGNYVVCRLNTEYGFIDNHFTEHRVKDRILYCTYYSNRRKNGRLGYTLRQAYFHAMSFQQIDLLYDIVIKGINFSNE